MIVASIDADELDSLLAIAQPLARSAPPRELILVRIVQSHDLASASRLLPRASRFALRRKGQEPVPRSSRRTNPGAELTRLAREQDADLLLLDAPADFLAAGELAGVVAAVLGSASCDVGIVVCRHHTPDLGLPVLVPFSPAPSTTGPRSSSQPGSRVHRTRRCVCSAARPTSARASGTRAVSSPAASLLVQRVVRVPTEPMLVSAGSAGILRAADEGGLLVFGLSDRWRQDGLGETRPTIAREAACPTLLVRKGLKPGGIAPGQTMTRFTWSLAASR